ncbi:hypothetical protein [Thermococcus aciditolerans]|uniref:Uncharacterized protein n=1 Tax=Thermococcus aciditolerans TaxID=2598455 RepID=A0A5C0SMR0_9EURY|nr:hypothetical protein [Thermococcus aciditolerans]QEK15026.1 hypothetical protein FPV09_07905 [Thermococcus aciditolerans]
MGGKALASVSAFSFMLNLFFGESCLSLDLLVPLLLYWLYLFGAGEKPRVGILVRDFAIIILAGTAGWIIGLFHK